MMGGPKEIMRRRNETKGEIKGMRGDILEQGATWVKSGL